MANIIDSISLDSSTKGIFTLPYGVCDTAAATTAKTVTLTNFVLETGAAILVKFTNGNTQDEITLNVNSSGAKSVYIEGDSVGLDIIVPDTIYMFVYDGSQWVMSTTTKSDDTLVTQYNTNSTYTSSYPIMFKYTAGTGSTTSYLRFATSGFSYNPSSGLLDVPGLIGDSGILYGSNLPTSNLTEGRIFFLTQSGAMNAFLDSVYPVGAIYMSVSSTSPATLFGGTWTKIQDTFLLADTAVYVWKRTA